MDQEFYKGIEASSMSVDDILREFHAQEAAAAAPKAPPKREAPVKREAPARREAPPKEPPRRPPSQRSTPRRSFDALLHAQQPKRMENKRAARASTEKPMERESEKQTAAYGERLAHEPEAAAPAETDEFSLDAILSEYGKVFAEKPVEQPQEGAAEETQFFTPPKPSRDSLPKASAEEYAAFAAGSSAVASSREKISALSSMAEEAMRYMSELTDADYDRMESAPKAPAKRDAGAERYNLSGHESTMRFGDKELDLSPDENYVPPVQKSEPIYHWTAGEEDLPDAPTEKPGLLQRIMAFNGSRRTEKKRPLNAPARRLRTVVPEAPVEETAAPEDEEEETPAAPLTDDTVVFDAVDEEGPLIGDASPVTDDTVIFTPSAEKRPAPEDAAFSFSFEDRETAPASYAAPLDETPPEDTFTEEKGEGEPEKTPAAEEAYEDDEALLDENAEFPSFFQYLSSVLTGTLYRLRGFSAAPHSATMDTGGEDLGPEVKPGEASKHYGSFLPSLKLRFQIGLVLLAILAWVNLGLPVTGMLRTVRVAAAMCLALQLTIMLLNLDVITNAAINLTRLRFGADSLAVFCCVLTSFDALGVALDAFGSAHMPLCLISSLSLMGVLYASYLSARGLRKSLRVPAIAKRCWSVTGENALKGKGITLLKTDRPITGFVRRSEEEAPDETAFLRAAPALLVLCFLLTIIVSAARHAGSDFLYLFTALLCPAVPVCALCCFALPFFIGSNRIFTVGAAVAGWSGLSDVGRSQNLIITDRDLFPEGSVEIDTVRIFADAEPEKILSYAGTMILASGSGVAPCFAELMNRNGGTIRHVDNFEFLPGGGMKGTIDGSTVLCGGTDLMRLMNVRIPYRLVDKQTVLLAVDNVLYGIFNLRYIPQPQVRTALIGLIRSSRHPVFAIRDFNVNPEMLRELFDVATDGYDFPPYMERFKLSEPPTDSDAPVAAVVCREGLGPLSLMADTGRSMYLATRFNLIVTLIASIAGVITVFTRLLSVGECGAPFLLLYLLLWAIPVVAASLYVKL